ncbi:MAG: alpha/beta fold hydrolase, partial [Myxococcota bacterium]
VLYVLLLLSIVLAVLAGLTVVVLRRRARRRAEETRQVEAEPVELDRASTADDGVLVPPPEVALIPVPHIQPVVLVHGLLGFQHVQLLGRRIVYFRGVAELLAERGVTVYSVKLPPTSSVPERAQALTDYIESLPCREVNLIAHSMGGLDSRYALSRLGLHQRVASLTSIATPHRGTPLADIAAWMGAAGPVRAMRSLVGRVGLDTEAVDWLTTRRTKELNAELSDIGDVYYGCVVGSAPRLRLFGNPVLLSGYWYIASRAGANDGMVPATSQYWGEIIDEVAADHWAQIGWSSYYDARQLYTRIIEMLRLRGL